MNMPMLFVPTLPLLSEEPLRAVVVLHGGRT